MLILSRKPEESIRISKDIIVTVLSVQGSKVRLGVQAPCTVPVQRTEIYKAIAKSNIRPPPCGP